MTRELETTRAGGSSNRELPSAHPEPPSSSLRDPTTMVSPSTATEWPNLAPSAASLAVSFASCSKSSLRRRGRELPLITSRASGAPVLWGAAAARQMKANARILYAAPVRGAERTLPIMIHEIRQKAE